VEGVVFPGAKFLAQESPRQENIGKTERDRNDLNNNNGDGVWQVRPKEG
jgi:hypothetical protein